MGGNRIVFEFSKTPFLGGLSGFKVLDELDTNLSFVLFTQNSSLLDINLKQTAVNKYRPTNLFLILKTKTKFFSGFHEYRSIDFFRICSPPPELICLCVLTRLSDCVNHQRLPPTPPRTAIRLTRGSSRRTARALSRSPAPHSEGSFLPSSWLAATLHRLPPVNRVSNPWDSVGLNHRRPGWSFLLMCPQSSGSIPNWTPARNIFDPPPITPV